jgi:hypothetical protein
MRRKFSSQIISAPVEIADKLCHHYKAPYENRQIIGESQGVALQFRMNHTLPWSFCKGDSVVDWLKRRAIGHSHLATVWKDTARKSRGEARGGGLFAANSFD